MKVILHLLVALSIFSSIIPVAFAVETTGSGIILLEPSVVNAGANSRVQFGQYMSTLFTTFITVAAVLAVLMIVIGGIQYITSFSGSGKEQGKERIWNAVFGLLIAVSAFLILQTVNPDLVSSDTLSLDIGKFSPIVSTSDDTGDQSYEEEAWNQCQENGFEACRPLMNGASCDTLNTDGSAAKYSEVPLRNCPKPEDPDDPNVKCCGKPIPPEKQRHIYMTHVNNVNCYRGPFSNKEECETEKKKETGTPGVCVTETTKKDSPARYCKDIENEAVTPQEESAVRSQLSQAGILVNRPDGCYDREGNQIRYQLYSQLYSGGCTTVGSLPQNGINKVMDLKNNCSGCDITITGGSELGHKTHGPGRAVIDLRKNEALNSYITSKAKSKKQTNYGMKYTMSDGSTYLDEVVKGGTPHWHVVFSEQ